MSLVWMDTGTDRAIVTYPKRGRGAWPHRWPNKTVYPVIWQSLFRILRDNLTASPLDSLFPPPLNSHGKLIASRTIGGDFGIRLICQGKRIEFYFILQALFLVLLNQRGCYCVVARHRYKFVFQSFSMEERGFLNFIITIVVFYYVYVFRFFNQAWCMGYILSRWTIVSYYK